MSIRWVVSGRRGDESVVVGLRELEQLGGQPAGCWSPGPRTNKQVFRIIFHAGLKASEET